MTTFLLADAAIVPWVDSPEQLTADAVEVMSAWAFWWDDERNIVALCDEDQH